jgi:peptidoglycan/xylan/chitin deacetylase (PgdA/CDA1 family)
MNWSGFRLDRALTTGVFHPLWRAGLVAGEFRLPILMYHSIGEEAEAGLAGYYRTATSPAVFREHLRQLSREGYKTMDLAEAVEVLAGQRAPGPGKYVVITFDDGFRNFYTEAFPALAGHGFAATMFLPTGYIGSGRQCFKGKECLTWREARELRQAGMGLGSHTVSHPVLYEESWERIERELRDSRQRMEDELGEAVRSFAYPYAFPQSDREFAEIFKEKLREAGYECCVTTELGRAKPGDDPYRLKRLPANGLDDAEFFRAKLEGGYDWLAWPQDIFKLARKLRRGRAALACI